MTRDHSALRWIMPTPARETGQGRIPGTLIDSSLPKYCPNEAIWEPLEQPGTVTTGFEHFSGFR
jgi:hypothetical protein